MRILRFLLTSLIMLVVVGAVVGLVARELWLVWGVNDIKTSLAQLRSISRNLGPYARECQQKGAELNESIIDTLQLRFLSNTDYVLEVVCTGFSLDPIVIDQRTLPPLIAKLPGSAGVIWGDEPSAVTIQSFGRKRTIVVEQQEIFYESYDAAIPSGTTPLSSCAGYGYECCSPESAVGVGDVYPAVTDCPRTCYASCQAIPLVLSFNTDPLVDAQTRTTSVRSGQEVRFTYIVAPQTEEYLVMLEYGDGESEDFREQSFSTTHTYDCAQPSCTYTARISVQENGVSSPDIPLSTIVVQVRGR